MVRQVVPELCANHQDEAMLCSISATRTRISASYCKCDDMIAG